MDATLEKKKITTLQDTILAAAIALTLVIVVVLTGDPLYLGFWYYLMVPSVIVGICIAIRPAPMFLTGAATAVTASLLAVMAVNWTAAKPEGLLGLGHIFSLPGGVLAAIVSAFVARSTSGAKPVTQFVLGFVGFGLGYFANQLVVCNTVMWCGFLSAPVR